MALWVAAAFDELALAIDQTKGSRSRVPRLRQVRQRPWDAFDLDQRALKVGKACSGLGGASASPTKSRSFERPVPLPAVCVRALKVTAPSKLWNSRRRRVRLWTRVHDFGGHADRARQPTA